MDAIQGLGIFPLNVRRSGVDFLAADGHKWILGPEGAGICYIRRDLLDQLAPVGVGWNSVQQGPDYDRIELNLRPAAARYEGGSWNMVGITGLASSLEFMLKYGAGPDASAIGQRVLEVTEMACELLRSSGATVISDRSPDHASGIVSFDFPGVPLPSARKLCEVHRVVLSVRSGHLRISPHAYNNQSDIENLIEALRQASGA